MEKESWDIETVDSLKDHGSMIWETVKDLRDIQHATLILDSSNMEKLMAKEFILGKMEKYMMENGTKV